MRHPGRMTLDTLPPEFVYGVEIYRSGDPVPAPYHGEYGLILIWTK